MRERKGGKVRDQLNVEQMLHKNARAKAAVSSCNAEEIGLGESIMIKPPWKQTESGTA